MPRGTGYNKRCWSAFRWLGCGAARPRCGRTRSASRRVAGPISQLCRDPWRCARPTGSMRRSSCSGIYKARPDMQRRHTAEGPIADGGGWQHRPGATARLNQRLNAPAVFVGAVEAPRLHRMSAGRAGERLALRHCRPLSKRGPGLQGRKLPRLSRLRWPQGRRGCAGHRAQDRGDVGLGQLARCVRQCEDVCPNLMSISPRSRLPALRGVLVLVARPIVWGRLPKRPNSMGVTSPQTRR